MLRLIIPDPVSASHGLGEPVIPTLQSLSTLAAAPSELGRVLTGIAIIESLAGFPFALFLLHFWNISTETVPGYISYIATVSSFLSGFRLRLCSRVGTDVVSPPLHRASICSVVL